VVTVSPWPWFGVQVQQALRLPLDIGALVFDVIDRRPTRDGVGASHLIVLPLGVLMQSGQSLSGVADGKNIAIIAWALFCAAIPMRALRYRVGEEPAQRPARSIPLPGERDDRAP
jgi:hypothetical protein